MACNNRNTIGGVLGIVTFCKSFLDALARERPRLPCVKGKRSAVAGVNDSPVDCQSRDRTARRRLAAKLTEGLCGESFEFA